jgi:hypothetical protein
MASLRTERNYRWVAMLDGYHILADEEGKIYRAERLVPETWVVEQVQRSEGEESV